MWETNGRTERFGFEVFGNSDGLNGASWGGKGFGGRREDLFEFGSWILVETAAGIDETGLTLSA
jgi:hypothetical protein